jgi:hypothetical protein
MPFIEDYKEFSPFGDWDCKSETTRLQDDYESIYFDLTPFGSRLLNKSTYIISGRRGAGKTALCKYLSFQKEFKNTHCIYIEDDDIERKTLEKISGPNGSVPQKSIAYARETWVYCVWNKIFEHFGLNEPIAKHKANGRLSDWLFDTLTFSDDVSVDVGIRQQTSSREFSDKMKKAFSFTAKDSLIVAIDTFEERCDPKDSSLMNSLAGLIEASAYFNLNYSPFGIHVKVFLPGEIYPFLFDAEVSNPLKYIKNPLHISWTSKDLLKLIAWRYGFFLRKNGLEANDFHKINWGNHRDVLQKLWLPYFGETIKNKRGVSEKTFSYVLRHTQSRPRQLIYACNEIARKSVESGNFPRFSQEDIVNGVFSAESDLAREVYNSYNLMYWNNASKIADALKGIDIVFKGKKLDELAKRSKKHWQNGEYDLSSFSRFVAQLGIVGRVERMDGFHVTAEFEYSRDDELTIRDDGDYVLHPMFCKKLEPKIPENPIVVYPFYIDRDGEILE